jgi:hypothetical protein
MSMAAGGLAVALLMQSKVVEKPVLQPPIFSIQQMGHLVSLKVNYSDLIEFNEPKSIDLLLNREIPLGSTSVLLVAKGDCTLATDLRTASYEKVDQ